MRKDRASRKANKGFTLIELMIVVAIIGILAAIAIPKFADLIRKSNEGATKGNLGATRSALSIYYGDLEGIYPSNPEQLSVNGKYLSAIPKSKAPPYHSDSSAFNFGTAISDAGGWGYVNAPTDANFGTIFVNCSHTDSKGSSWSTY